MIEGNKHLRILVTGGNGYIGQHLQKWLYNNTDWDVNSLDKSTGFDLLGDRSIQHLETYDCVIHLASLTGVRASRLIPHRYMKDNIAMTMRILNQCNEYDVPCLVASSSSVEELRSSYAYSKYAIEQICKSYPYNRIARIFRPFTVYGHNMEGVYRSNMLYGMIVDNKVPETVINARRDFTHINDVCSAIQLIALNRHNGTPDKPIDIGYASPITTKTFLELHNIDTSKISFTEPNHEYNESHYTCASPSALYKLGWAPLHISRHSSSNTL